MSTCRWWFYLIFECFKHVHFITKQYISWKIHYIRPNKIHQKWSWTITMNYKLLRHKSQICNPWFPCFLFLQIFKTSFSSLFLSHKLPLLSVMNLLHFRSQDHRAHRILTFFLLRWKWWNEMGEVNLNGWIFFLIGLERYGGRWSILKATWHFLKLKLNKKI